VGVGEAEMGRPGQERRTRPCPTLGERLLKQILRHQMLTRALGEQLEQQTLLHL